MGYELGFTTKDYDESDSDWHKNVIWFWCGWENTTLFEALSLLSKEGFTHACSDTECHIPVINLIFIKHTYEDLTRNKNYVIYSRLADLDLEVAEEFLNALSPQEKAEMYLAFPCRVVANNKPLNCKDVVKILFKRTFYDTEFILESLAHAIQEMQDKGIEEVVLYGG